VTLLQGGDANTGFCHKMTRARRSRNAISILHNNVGEQITAPGDIQNEILNFYQNLSGKADEVLVFIIHLEDSN
jgi:hypothetical protein